MTRQLHPLLRRALALGLLLAAFYGAYGLMHPVYAAYADDVAAIAQLEHALARYRSASQDLPALERQLLDIERQPTAQAGYLAGSDVDIAAATLQDHLKRLIRRAGGEIKSSLVLPNRMESARHRIGARTQIVASLAPLQRILHDIETMTPLLFVDALEVRVISRPRQPADEEPLLDIRFDVSGFVRATP
jgi:general secretion pathway protein M